MYIDHPPCTVPSQGNELFFDGFSALLAESSQISFEDAIWPQMTAILRRVGSAACDAMRNDPGED